MNDKAIVDEELLIFLVEDSDMYAIMLQHKLSKEGPYCFRTFASGEECLASMHLNPFVIILDYNLSGMDGLQTLIEIKKRDRRVPVIILSGQQDLKIAIDVFGAGAFEYVAKDVDTIRELSRAIHRLDVNKESRTTHL